MEILLENYLFLDFPEDLREKVFSAYYTDIDITTVSTDFFEEKYKEDGLGNILIECAIIEIAEIYEQSTQNCKVDRFYVSLQKSLKTGFKDCTKADESDDSAFFIRCFDYVKKEDCIEVYYQTIDKLNLKRNQLFRVINDISFKADNCAEWVVQQYFKGSIDLEKIKIFRYLKDNTTAFNRELLALQQSFISALQTAEVKTELWERFNFQGDKNEKEVIDAIFDFLTSSGWDEFDLPALPG